MKLYHALYLEKGLQSQKDEILEKIKERKWQLNKYLIVLSNHETNQLEFFHSVLLMQKSIQTDTLFVVGIAKGYDGAAKLVQEITQEVVDKTGRADIRQYVLQSQQEYEENKV